ncbi:MAG: 16S rRNA (guanine(527)-N(7))-methyltransferase RsmG [Acidithiobacillus sp.]|nr:16S rRNA (guanine(527)-N(7))-methyltransferase RsmG [Acidithiobacillus sp.]
MDSQWESLRTLLDAGLQRLGLAEQVPEATRSNLLLYVEELERWNRTHNLTAVRDRFQMVSRHLLDSLTFVQKLPDEVAILDIGSGAGLPGIPLAMLRPAQTVVLVEPAVKKVAFLRHVLGRLSLTNVQVAPYRVEDLQFDGGAVLISRATAEVADFLQMTQHLLEPGREILLAKGPRWAVELERCPRQWQEGWELVPLPELDGGQRVLLHRRIGQRPDRQALVP